MNRKLSVRFKALMSIFMMMVGALILVKPVLNALGVVVPFLLEEEAGQVIIGLLFVLISFKLYGSCLKAMKRKTTR